MKKCTVLFLVFAAAAALAGDAAFEKAREILSSLTLEEKAALCGGNGTMSMAANPAKGIPAEWQFSDSSHTVRANMERWTWDCISSGDESTVLPTLSALAATWNRDLAAAHGHVMGEEGRARGKDQLLGPGVNIMRTPLCGRNWEYLSEDPCLTAELAVPEIAALQSHDVAATVKHFCLNNQEWNRHDVDTICDERTLNEIYLPAFEAAIHDADVWSVMTSYNKVDGDWASENTYLQRGILRDRWNFKGMIVTDWGGQHSTVKAALAGAGVEANRGSDIRYFTNPKEGTFPIAEAVRKGEIPEAVVDEIALHTLYTMAKAKFFTPELRDKGSRNTPEHQAVARAIGEEAVILFKNDANVLPLDAARVKKLLVVGKLADTRQTLKGWSAEGKPLYEITPLAGLKEYFEGKDVEIKWLPLVAADGANLVHDVIESSIGTFDTTAQDEGMSLRSWEVAYYNSKDTSTAPVKETFARTVGFDAGRGVPLEGLDPANFAITYHTKLIAPETGDYTFRVEMDHRGGATITLDGRNLATASEVDNVICQASLEEGKTYDFTVEYRGDTGEHRMKFGWCLPSETGSLEDIRIAAADADATLVFTGTEVGHGQALECEGADRPNLKLPEGHDAAIREILSWNLKNLVIVTHSGAPLELPWVDDAATILHQPFLGQEAGRPLAKVIFGDVNPSGKLPCTWPVKLEDTPAAVAGTYNGERVIYNEGVFVGYRWYDTKGIKPLFAFGHGLSYTTFEYGEVEVEDTCCGWLVRLPVTNTGTREGKETVQLYVTEDAPTVPRPAKELRNFAKLPLAPGETAIAELEISAKDLAYWDVLNHCWKANAGVYTISLGTAADKILRTVKVTLPETVLIH